MKKKLTISFVAVALVFSVAAIEMAKADDSAAGGVANNPFLSNLRQPGQEGNDSANAFENAANQNQSGPNWGDASDWNLNGTQESVSIKPNGDFRVTGAVVNSVASSSNMLNANFFGFSRNIDVTGAKIMGGGQQISLGDINVGDKLSGQGNFNESSRAITVTSINDVSYSQRNTSNIQSQIQSLLQMVQQLQAQLKAMIGQ